MKKNVRYVGLCLLAVGVAQAAELESSDGAYEDYFGYSVSAAGTMGLSGACWDDDYGSRSGSAYLYRNLDTASGTVTQTAKLLASDSAEGDQFGTYVSLSGTTGLVGAYGDDDKGSSSGSAYLYRNLDTVSGTVTETAKLVASDGESFDYFGRSVSLSGSAGMVGAQSDDDETGSAYLYRGLDTATGTVVESAKLVASDGAIDNYFGRSVSLSGTMGMVGAFYDDDNGDASGSAYLYRNLDVVSGTVTESVKLLASNGAAGDQFGDTVSLSGSLGLVGARYVDDNGASSGAAYFYRDLDTASGIVTESVKLVASDGEASDLLGSSVSLSGTTGLVGALGDDDGSNGSGSAYLYRNLDSKTGVVTEDVKLRASAGEEQSTFGYAVSLDSDRFVISASKGDGAATDSGKAYSGSVKSVTTLDDGNASGTISGISFESRTDWVIGETTDDNTVTLSFGDIANVTESGKAVYIGKDASADFNELAIAGLLLATEVNIGADGNIGNLLRLEDSADISNADLFRLAMNNALEIEGDVADVATGLLLYLDTTELQVWSGADWEILTADNADELVSISYDGSYTTVAAVPEPASAALILLGSGVAFVIRRRFMV